MTLQVEEIRVAGRSVDKLIAGRSVVSGLRARSRRATERTLRRVHDTGVDTRAQKICPQPRAGHSFALQAFSKQMAQGSAGAFPARVTKSASLMRDRALTARSPCPADRFPLAGWRPFAQASQTRQRGSQSMCAAREACKRARFNGSSKLSDDPAPPSTTTRHARNELRIHSVFTGFNYGKGKTAAPICMCDLGSTKSTNLPTQVLHCELR